MTDLADEREEEKEEEGSVGAGAPARPGVVGTRRWRQERPYAGTPWWAGQIARE